MALKSMVKEMQVCVGVLTIVLAVVVASALKYNRSPVDSLMRV